MENNNVVQKKTTRPPVVVVMGHIDHGKSMILETIRKTKMLEKEAGGITQHIGAYEVEHEKKKITFIDTPGHEAFSKMRSRGAKVADIAVLVVAADEGVKPQTKEAIQIIRHSNLPFLVALNKIDKAEANAERVKKELAQEDILVESYGGKIPSIEVSAKTGQNLNELLEIILLMADLEGLSTDHEKPAIGVTIEAHLDPRRGFTATLLIQDGTLDKKHILVMGRNVEKIKIIEDFQGKPIDHANPSSPVRIAGLGTIPTIGEPFRAFEKKTEAETYIASLTQEFVSPREIPIQSREKPIFNIIMKADVSGSLEVLEELLKKLQSDAIDIRLIRSEIGNINESDIKLAMATKLVTVVGFKVRIDPTVEELAKSANIHILTGQIIYELMETMKEKIIEMIPPEIKRIDLGKIKILKVFRREGIRQIVGGRIEEGIVKKGARVDVKRFKELVGSGGLVELQREKVPAEEVSKGFECGMLIDTKTVIKEGDVLEVYQEEVTKRTL